MWRNLGVLLLLLVSAPANAAWLVAETPHFRLHATMSDARIRQEAAILEDYHNLLELLTRQKFAEDAPKLDIFLVDSTAQMQIVGPWTGDNIGGFYANSPGGIFIISREPKSTDDKWYRARHILQHEYAHHFTMQAGNTALPAWYVEGFAEYMMTAEFKPTSVDFGDVSPSRLYVLRNQPWGPLDQLLRGASGMDPGLFYAQSWLLTHYLNRTEGMPAKRDAYLEKVARGADPREAFKSEIDPDLAQFQAKLQAYAKGRQMNYSRMQRTPPPLLEIRVEQLPPSADAMLLPVLALQMGQPKKHEDALMARLRKDAARYPDDPWAKRAIAIAEAVSGDDKVAARLLDAQLQTMPNDPELLRWRASLYHADRSDASAQDIAAARKLLVRAFRQAPNDWRVLRDYADTHRPMQQAVDVGTLEVLIKARQLAPQEPNLAMTLGITLARSGRYDLAAAAIAPVLNNPHSDGGLALERGLFDALKSGEADGVEAALLGLKLGRSTAAASAN